MTSFIALFRSTGTRVRSCLALVAAGAVVFALLFTATQWVIGARVQQQVWMHAQSDGIDAVRMEELGRRMEAGDEAAMNEMIAVLEQGLSQVQGMTPEEQDAFYARKSIEILIAVAPLLALSLVLWCLIALVASTYFLVLGVEEPLTIGAAIRRTGAVFGPLLGVWFWSFLKAWGWLPVLVAVPAFLLAQRFEVWGVTAGAALLVASCVPLLLFGPRFALAGVLNLRDACGVHESIKRSFDRTQGYWSTVLGYLILEGLVLGIALVIVGTLAGILSPQLLLVELFIGGVVQQVALAFYVFFLVGLTAAIAPLSKSAAKPVAVRAGTKKTVTKK